MESSTQIDAHIGESDSQIVLLVVIQGTVSMETIRVYRCISCVVRSCIGSHRTPKAHHNLCNPEI